MPGLEQLPRAIFLKRITELRRQHKMTIAALAAKLGLARQSVYDWYYTDSPMVSEATIFAVCNAFGIDAEYFFAENLTETVGKNADESLQPA